MKISGLCYCGEWRIEHSYDALSVVKYHGLYFVAICRVPAGTGINERMWLLI